MTRPRGWMVFRGMMLIAAGTLGAYIVCKSATRPHAFTGLYAVLFPLSIVVTAAGLALSIKPALAFRTPYWVRSMIGIAAGGWLVNGVLCVPSLTATTLSAPAAGLFATGHMVLQHIVLTVAVAALALAPKATYRWFGLETPANEDHSRHAVTLGEA